MSVPLFSCFNTVIGIFKPGCDPRGRDRISKAEFVAVVFVTCRGPSDVVECFEAQVFNPECSNSMLGIRPWEYELIHVTKLTGVATDCPWRQEIAKKVSRGLKAVHASVAI